MRKTLLILLVFACGLTLRAQDYVRVPETDSNDSLALATGKKSVKDFTMQKRYRPKDKYYFDNSKFGHNLYIGGGIGGTYSLNYDFGPGFAVQVDAAKLFARYHWIKLSVGASFFTDNYTSGQARDFYARASYMFDLTNYLSGYDPSRNFSFGIFIGGQYVCQTLPDYESKHSGGAHFGLDMRFRITPMVDIAIDPIIEGNYDAIGRNIDYSWRKIRANAGCMVSVYCHLPEMPAIYKKSDYRMWSLVVLGGAMLQNSSHVMTSANPYQWLTPSFCAGVRREYNGPWGWRALIDGSYSDILYDEGEYLRSIYAGLCFDGTLDLVGIFAKNKEKFFSLYAIVGLNAGYVSKVDDYINVNAPYVGGRFGACISMRLASRFALLIEPMYQIIPYSTLNSDSMSTSVNRNYSDGLITVRLGLEYKFGKK